MRTPEEWYAKRWTTGKSGVDWVRAIQQDALEAAAQVCDDVSQRHVALANEFSEESPGRERFYLHVIGAEICKLSIRALMPEPPKGNA